ncbi:AbrB family transcriptional regulator [Oleispirillum naphthae]|uniref:AbrB family transcriptional regulator n=1 Tax=Oleispirillum naphthae TaxID=2838853 RepID=UPI0030826662
MLAKFGPRGQWAALLLMSVAVTVILKIIDLPGALLLGAMASGIIVALNGAKLKVPGRVYILAQAVIGAMMAGAVTPDILKTFLGNWMLFLSVVLSTVIASGVVGWAMSRWRMLPGTSGIWGNSPGAASAMVVMAEEFGADVRIVAFMQYMRVLCVALSAAVIAHISAGAAAPHPSGPGWFAVPELRPFAETLALIVGGVILSRVVKIPSGSLLIPLIIGAVLRSLGLLDLVLPQPLLLFAYAMIGWTVGLRFTAEIMRTVAAKLPHMMSSIIGLMIFCAGIGWLLTRVLGIDMLTAYLATSPGGADSIAIIAASTNVDLGFVLAFQTVRLIVVVVVAPIMARRLAKSMGHKPG